MMDRRNRSGMSKIPLERHFPESGWVLEKQVLDADSVRQCRTFFEERLADLDRQFGHGQLDDSAPAYRHYLRGEFDLETRLDFRVVQLLSTARVTKFVSQFLGVDRYLIHYPPMIRFKRPGAAASAVPLHQDSAYNAHLQDFITVWVPLVDIDEECGGVIVYPGTHHQAEMPHSAAGGWEAGLSEEPGLGDAHHVLMDAGDVLLFPKNLLHKSAPHRSPDRIRFSVDFRVFFDPSQTSKSFFDVQTGQVTRA